MSKQVEAFKLTVPVAHIADLHDRLERTRFPDQAPGPAWAYGTDVAWIRGLIDYWREKFDWAAQEARLNAFSQCKVRLHDIDLHFLHVEGQGPDPYPLLLSHGWPGSVFEFLELIPRLTNPSSFGGDPADSFTVIAPSLPGYGLSFSPGQPRFGVEEIADCFASLMTDVLGYRRFGAQGGDWGSFITSRLAYSYPDLLGGIHLNMMPLRRDPKMVADPTSEEQKYLEQLAT
jgi:pimeloyl-ACP methyl ester carboxylesterase